MPTETAQSLKTPAFSYRGFDIPALDISADIIADLGTSEPAYKLAPKSAPLAWRVGLYMVGRDLVLDEEDAKSLPEPVRQAGAMVYGDCHARTEPGKGSGAWHKDGILFEPGTSIKGSMRPGDDHIAARYFIDIEGFDEKTGDIKPFPHTREERIWVPYGDGRFIVPTRDGAYDPVTGIPLETIADSKKAIKRWVDTGLTQEQAEAELSKFYRSGSGIRAVLSWSGGGSGSLCVIARSEHRGRYSYIGSFAASRSAERSEAPKNTGFTMLTKTEYEAFEKDREILGEMRENLQQLAKK